MFIKLFLFAMVNSVFFLSINSCGTNNTKQEKTRPNRPATIELETLKKEIINFDEPLTYCQFFALQKSGALSPSQADELINYAYENDNPVLFKPAKHKVLTKDFSLNLFWVSLNPVEESHPISGADLNRFQLHILSPLKDWLEKQPESIINFWYDKDMVKEQSLILTQEKLAQNNIDLRRVRFRNIRDIEVVKKHPLPFSAEAPLYTKVDITKAVIADHVLREDNIPYVVVSDSDVVAITREQLFDQRSLDGLNNTGYIQGTVAEVPENSFIMLYNHSQFELLSIHREVVVDEAIAIIEENLRNKSSMNAELVFYRYAYLRQRIRKLRNIANKAIKDGFKSMIFPPSSHGGNGYSDTQLKALKEALVGPEGCKS